MAKVSTPAKGATPGDMPATFEADAMYKVRFARKADALGLTFAAGSEPTISGTVADAVKDALSYAKRA